MTNVLNTLKEANERGEMPDPYILIQSLETILPRLQGLPEQASEWSEANAELAYHSVKALLLIEPPRFAEAERWLNQLDQALQAAGQDDRQPGIRVF